MADEITYQVEDGTLNVIKKYEELMQTTLDKSSIYMRAKDTMYEQFKDLQITEKEKAGLIADYVLKFSTDMSAASMSSALKWAQEERDGQYTLAKIEADTKKSTADTTLVEAQTDKVAIEKDLVCAQITKTIAESIRQNGRVETYEEGDTCRPKTLFAEGLLFHQDEQVQADTYTRYADAYRKSGVVQIGSQNTPVINTEWVDDGQQTDPDVNGNSMYIYVTDGYTKGLAGDSAGYTHQQEINAERLRISYEDSKVNHAANSAASMIGQMLTAEVTPKEQDVQRWRDAMDRLLNPDVSTPIEGQCPIPLYP